MLILKEFVFISAILISASLGLVEISTNYITGGIQSPLQINADKTPSVKVNQELTDKFFIYLDLIQNRTIDKRNIQSDINSLKSDFEKKYLTALLDKRNENYEAAFKQLYSLLKEHPRNFEYYEQLVLLSKITKQLHTLSAGVEEVKDTNNYFNLFLKGLIEKETGKSEDAINTFNNIINRGYLFKEIYYQLSYTLRIAGNYKDAFLNLRRAEELCHKKEPYLAKIINLKGTLFFLSAEYGQAKKNYEFALQVSVQNKNTTEEIRATANLAIIKDQYGEVVAARRDFFKAIRMAEKIQNNDLLAFLYSELGVSYTYTNNLIEARNNYEKSFSLFMKVQNDERLAYLSSNIGSLFLQISNYKSALKFYNKGLEFSGENKLGQILNLTGLADVYSNESNYSKALEYYNRAKKIADSIKDISSTVKIDRGIGALYYNISRPLISLETLRKAEALINGSQMPFELIKLYSDIGMVLTSIDSINQAESYYKKGLKISEAIGDGYGSVLIKTELAFNFYEQGNYDQSEILINSAQKSAKEYNLTQLLGLQELYSGKLLEQRNENREARKKFNNAFRLSKKVSDFNNQIEAGYELAKSFERANEYEQAERWYRQTIDLIEKISFPLTLNQEIQISHYSGFNEIYNSFIELYLKQEKYQEAFLLLESSRAKNTRLNLDKLKLLSQLKNEEEFDKLIDVQWMISSGLYNETVKDSLNNILSGIKLKILNKNKNLSEILNSNFSPDLQKFKSELSPDEYLFSIYTGEKATVIFNLNSKGLFINTIKIKRDSLLQMLEKISSVYKSGLQTEEVYMNEDLFSFNAYASYKFYKTIFEESLNSVPANSRIILSLPFDLIKLPLEMLVTEWNDDESPYYYNDKKFLLSKYEFVYSPSAAIYFEQKEKNKETKGQNLLVGDPFIENSKINLSVRTGFIYVTNPAVRDIKLYPLSYSEAEINNIEGLIDNNVVLLSKDATENNFKKYSPESKILHISSHSFLIKDQPLIMFSQTDRKDDGFLELGEIVQLGLNSDLVVLSSCRSGLGRVDAAEGIIGMQKAFFEAGSKSVIVSLWDVNDKYTAYFMRDFYEQLASGKSKSEALREAKLNFIKNYSANPYYWSAFVLAGNPSALKLKERSSHTYLYILAIILIAGIIFYRFNIKTKNNFTNYVGNSL